jgi:MFS family permease
MKLSFIDAFLYYLMVGIGETYLPAYVLSIGMNEIFAGILSSLPLMSGAFLQLFTPKGLQKVGSHKYWVVGTATMQALSFLPLIYYSMGHKPGFFTLFLILTLYWAANFAAGPAWNYWMGELVPAEMATRYFSKRTRISQIGLLIGVVAGGIFLQKGVEIAPFSSVFAGLFAISFACRLASSFLLSKHHFRKEWLEKHNFLGVRASFKIFLNSGIKRKFFLYFLPLQMAVNMSSPFVTPYMLAQLKVDYWTFMLATAMALVGKIACLALIKFKEDDIDPFKLFTVGLIAICPSPILWTLSSSISYIMWLQFMSGMAWGCFEVGLFLILFKDLRQEEKVPVLTIYNLITAAGTIAGTMIGGEILRIIGTSKSSYWTLFLVGGILRVGFMLILLRTLKVWQRTQTTIKKKAA